MLPPEADTGQPAALPRVNLEDRLRGLILNNAASETGPSSSMLASQNRSLPPHLRMATPEDQEEYLVRPPAVPKSDPPLGPIPGAQVQSGRKRLNQAQRRQMNSQLSIPIDTRPQQNVPLARGYANTQPPPYPGNPQTPNHQRSSQQTTRFQQPSSIYPPHAIYQQGAQGPSKGHYHEGNQHFNTRQGHQYPQHHFQPGGFNQTGEFGRPPPQNRQLFQPGAPTSQGRGRPLMHHEPNDLAMQSNYLEMLCREHVPKAEIDIREEADKESFRIILERACQDAITEFERQELGNAEFDPLSVQLKCFGSMSSGFATKASDMDLALLTPHSTPAADSPESCIPRILEKKLLDAGYGARLLTRTRVPIIKLCEKPTEKLRFDLVEERTKWEASLTEDENGLSQIPEAETLIDDAETLDDKPSSSPIPSPTDLALPKQMGNRNDEENLSLQQKENQSLADYYGSAKQVLRKTGVFDLTTSSPQHDTQQLKVLNGVCKAFVAGLNSELLIMRLRGYSSISPLFDEPPTIVQRSLSGIWTQIEGERLAMAYESRSLAEADERREAQCLSFVEQWRKLQGEFEPLGDALAYNRKLYMAYERLKNMSSLALPFLEEIQSESVSYYAARARRLMHDLQFRVPVHSNRVASIVIARYITGIKNSQIRRNLEDSNSDTSDFEQVVRQHKALQLALDFEHAMKMDLYTATDLPFVKRFVTFLRSSKFGSGPPTMDGGLLAVIRKLPDPTKIASRNPRDRYRDPLEFPKTDVGIQCDINFSAHLALHNTLLLRCYSHSDPRVRILVLFVKHWAKTRAINTPYRGTLSSYGYVLMVLHYLVNIAFPFVCPNLQEIRKDPPAYLPPAEIAARTTCQGRDIRFWRNEAEIRDLAGRGLLNQNKDSVGFLLRGFFEYFAQATQMSTANCRGFDWGREVLSLRTLGGLLTKQDKGWTGAKTVFETTTIAAPPTPFASVTSAHSTKDGFELVVDGEVKMKTTKIPAKTIEETKEIRHRYLFAIEDPFELDHNVARTVTHNGIVSIRDEFRRAWRIIRNVGKGNTSEGLLEPASTEGESTAEFMEVLQFLHVADREVGAATA